MANQNNENTSARELSVREFKTLENASLTAITLGIVGTAHKGPAFVPQIISTYDRDESPTGTLNTYEDTFGNLGSLKEPNPAQINAYEWFNQGGEQIAKVRLLGMGLSGVANSEGIVEGSGFTVGGNVVSGSSTLGVLGSNSYATSGGSVGRTNFVVTNFKKNQYVTGDDGINKISSFNDYLQQIGEDASENMKKMVTDVVMCPSGTQLLIESSNITTSALATLRDEVTEIDFADNTLGSSTSVSNPRILVKGLKNTEYNLINDYSSQNFRHNLTKSTFSENVFNRESTHILQKGHYNYSSFYPQKDVLKVADEDKYSIIFGSNQTKRPNIYYYLLKNNFHM